MKWKKHLVLVSIVVIVIFSYFTTIGIQTVANPGERPNEIFDLDLLETSDSSNFETLEAIFDAKNSDYASNGYYPQIYSGSLQATYYALYVLDAVG